MPEISVIIPALDEEASIGHVIRQVPSFAVGEIIVVDNYSTDHTAQIAEDAGARVINQTIRGYGAACLAGAQAAKGEVMVFIDGDGSFDPQEIPAVVAPLLEGRADLVLGSRQLGASGRAALLPHQRFGNGVAAALLRCLYGLKVTDLGPFRAIRSPLLWSLHMREMTSGWPVEMMVKAARSRARMVEVPVSYRNRLGGRSKVSGTITGSLKAGYHILRIILKYA